MRMMTPAPFDKKSHASATTRGLAPQQNRIAPTAVQNLDRDVRFLAADSGTPNSVEKPLGMLTYAPAIDKQNSSSNHQAMQTLNTVSLLLFDNSCQDAFGASEHKNLLNEAYSSLPGLVVRRFWSSNNCHLDN